MPPNLSNSFKIASIFTFIVLLLITLYQPEVLKTTKITLIILFGIYGVVGALGIVIPEFLIIRNLGFVINLGVAAFLFYRSGKFNFTGGQFIYSNYYKPKPLFASY